MVSTERVSEYILNGTRVQCFVADSGWLNCCLCYNNVGSRCGIQLFTPMPSTNVFTDAGGFSPLTANCEGFYC